MRTAQVSIHVKLFGSKQLSEDHLETYGTTFDVHSYVDSNSFPEALMAAMVDVSSKVEKVRGRAFGARRDMVASDMEGDDAQMARNLEPSRPVDVRDIRLIAEHIERESGKAAADAVLKQARMEKRLVGYINQVRAYLESDEYKEMPSDQKERFAREIACQAETLQQLADDLS